MIGFVVVGEVCILLPNADEPPQAIAMGLLVTFGSAVIAAAASLFERIVRSATSVDAEN